LAKTIVVTAIDSGANRGFGTSSVKDSEGSHGRLQASAADGTTGSLKIQVTGGTPELVTDANGAYFLLF